MHLPRAAALFARFVCGAVLRPRSLTGSARLIARICDVLRTAFRRVEKTQRNFHGDVLALRFRLRARSRSAAERTENIPENIFKSAEPRKSAAGAAARKSAEPAHVGVFQLEIVLLSAFFVGQDLVRLVYFFEFFRAGGVVGVQVGVILLDEFPVSALDFVLARRFGNP